MIYIQIQKERDGFILFLGKEAPTSPFFKVVIVCTGKKLIDENCSKAFLCSFSHLVDVTVLSNSGDNCESLLYLLLV